MAAISLTINEANNSKINYISQRFEHFLEPN